MITFTAVLMKSNHILINELAIRNNKKEEDDDLNGKMRCVDSEFDILGSAGALVPALIYSSR